MIADIGTRKGATIGDVNSQLVWISGYPWMKLKVAVWPIQTIDEVKLNQQELTAIKTETQTKLINSTIITDNSKQHIFHSSEIRYWTDRKEVCLLTVPY